MTADEAKIQKEIDLSSDVLVGLDYVAEYQGSETHSELSYHCNLCDSECKAPVLFPHILGVKHRLNYIEKVDTKAYEEIKNLKVKRSELSSRVAEKVTELVKKLGRGKIKIKIPEVKPVEIKPAEEKPVSKPEVSNKEDKIPVKFKGFTGPPIDKTDKKDTVYHEESDTSNKKKDETSQNSNKDLVNKPTSNFQQKTKFSGPPREQKNTVSPPVRPNYNMPPRSGVSPMVNKPYGPPFSSRTRDDGEYSRNERNLEDSRSLNPYSKGTDNRYPREPQEGRGLLQMPPSEKCDDYPYPKLGNRNEPFSNERILPEHSNLKSRSRDFPHNISNHPNKMPGRNEFSQNAPPYPMSRSQHFPPSGPDHPSSLISRNREFHQNVKDYTDPIIERNQEFLRDISDRSRNRGFSQNVIDDNERKREFSQSIMNYPERNREFSQNVMDHPDSLISRGQQFPLNAPSRSETLTRNKNQYSSDVPDNFASARNQQQYPSGAPDHFDVTLTKNKEATPDFQATFKKMSTLDKLKLTEKLMVGMISSETEASLATVIVEKIRKGLLHYKIQTLPSSMQEVITKSLLEGDLKKLENITA